MKRRRLQDEAAQLASQIEELRSIEHTTQEESDAATARIAEMAVRCDEITKELGIENDLDAKLKALRSVVVDDCEARSVIEPNKNEEKAVDVNNRYLRGIARGEIRAMGETSPTYDNAGAELVPVELFRGIINEIERQSVGARVASVFTASSNKLVLPKVADATAAFYSEAAQGNLTDLATSGVEVSLFGIRSLAAISNDLIEDAAADIFGIFSRAAARGFATRIDTAWLQGDETAGIDGLVGEVEESIAVASAGATTPENLASVVGLVDPAAMNTAWVVSPAGYGALLAAHTSTGAAMVTDAMAPTCFGRPVYVTNAMPSGTLALYGDFSLATAVAVKANGLSISALREVRAVNDQTVFLAKQRLGIKNHAPQFVAKLIID
jgi:HK97 family phage major capsid protein